MLSYRHAFHVGNHGDVLKHAVLARTLAYLAEKEAPLLYLDTHAGAGSYDLRHDMARRTGEAAQGIGRLWEEQAPPALLQPYWAALRTYNKGALRYYPGSPLIARQLLRPTDRAICYELHPTDYPLLAIALGNDRRFHVLREDGLNGLPAHLPPRERRGLILLDPSYERDVDYRTVPSALQDALRRFPIGVYLVWYPLLNHAPVIRMLKTISALAGSKILRIELALAPPGHAPGLTGSGMLLINPPWVLDAELREALPWLVQRLGNKQSIWRLETM
jgi:23S rRNA (adenine2030-N6)-methyltransferase